MTTRQYWLQLMDQIARPVLSALAEDKLRQVLPIESKSSREDREQYTYLEAFGRTLTGIAPWLELEGLTGEEAALQAEYRRMVLAGLHNAVTPGAGMMTAAGPYPMPVPGAEPSSMTGRCRSAR